jgi:hypothetical protein
MIDFKGIFSSFGIYQPPPRQAPEPIFKIDAIQKRFLQPVS